VLNIFEAERARSIAKPWPSLRTLEETFLGPFVASVPMVGDRSAVFDAAENNVRPFAERRRDPAARRVGLRRKALPDRLNKLDCDTTRQDGKSSPRFVSPQTRVPPLSYDCPWPRSFFIVAEKHLVFHLTTVRLCQAVKSSNL